MSPEDLGTDTEAQSMSSSNPDDGPFENDRSAGTRPVPGEELYLMSGDVFVLCSVERPSTRWISTSAVTDLHEWR